MAEREFVERIAWDTDSIVDAAIDTSVEVLKIEGSVGAESLRRIGQTFSFVRSNPHRDLTIFAPCGRIPLVTFIPPLEFSINRYDLDTGEFSGEAYLVVHNPLSAADASAYRKRQMDLVLATRLADVSGPYKLKQRDLVVTFPSEHYAQGVERFIVPILGQV